MADRLHLGWFSTAGPGGAAGDWKRTTPGYDWRTPELYQDIARACERGRFDFVFFADGLAMPQSYGGTWDAYARAGLWMPYHDPVPIASMLAATTSRIGIVTTLSTTFCPPYLLARLLSTLDHLSRGRIGWNVVTSVAKLAAQNFGFDDLPSHDDRYDIADEYLELCHALWGSWAPDALALDRDADLFARPERIRAVDFEGEHFRSRGPLNVSSSPQVHPVIFQAGASPRGRQFAARHAEVAVVGGTPATLRAYASDLRTRLSDAGRDPYSCKVMCTVKPVLGDTHAIAVERAEAADAAVTVELGLLTMSEYLGVDLSGFDLDGPLPELQVEGFRSRFDDYRASGLTVREIALREAKHDPFPVRGTGEEVAEQLLATSRECDVDGFLLRPGLHNIASVVEFVDGAVPALQRMGAFRTDYAGSTLREHIAER